MRTLSIRTRTASYARLMALGLCLVMISASVAPHWMSKAQAQDEYNDEYDDNDDGYDDDYDDDDYDDDYDDPADYQDELSPGIAEFEGGWSYGQVWYFEGRIEYCQPNTTVEVSGASQQKVTPDEYGYFYFSVKVPPKSEYRLYIEAATPGGGSHMIYYDIRT